MRVVLPVLVSVAFGALVRRQNRVAVDVSAELDVAIERDAEVVADNEALVNRNGTRAPPKTKAHCLKQGGSADSNFAPEGDVWTCGTGAMWEFCEKRGDGDFCCHEVVDKGSLLQEEVFAPRNDEDCDAKREGFRFFKRCSVSGEDGKDLLCDKRDCYCEDKTEKVGKNCCCTKEEGLAQLDEEQVELDEELGGLQAADADEEALVERSGASVFSPKSDEDCDQEYSGFRFFLRCSMSSHVQDDDRYESCEKRDCYCEDKTSKFGKNCCCAIKDNVGSMVEVDEAMVEESEDSEQVSGPRNDVDCDKEHDGYRFFKRCSMTGKDDRFGSCEDRDCFCDKKTEKYGKNCCCKLAGSALVEAEAVEQAAVFAPETDADCDKEYSAPFRFFPKCDMSGKDDRFVACEKRDCYCAEKTEHYGKKCCCQEEEKPASLAEEEATALLETAVAGPGTDEDCDKRYTGFRFFSHCSATTGEDGKLVSCEKKGCYCESKNDEHGKNCCCKVEGDSENDSLAEVEAEEVEEAAVEVAMAGRRASSPMTDAACEKENTGFRFFVHCSVGGKDERYDSCEKKDCYCEEKTEKYGKNCCCLI